MGGREAAGLPCLYLWNERTAIARACCSGFPAMSSYFRGILARLAVGFRTLAPRQRTGAFIKPWILPRHLPRPGYPPGEAADRDHVERIGQIRQRREQLRIEQGEMDEADRGAQERHVAHAVPGRPPSAANAPAAPPGRPPAENPG